MILSVSVCYLWYVFNAKKQIYRGVDFGEATLNYPPPVKYEPNCKL